MISWSVEFTVRDEGRGKREEKALLLNTKH
jgi:hypothetical protein